MPTNGDVSRLVYVRLSGTWRCGIHYALAERTGLVGRIEKILSSPKFSTSYSSTTSSESLVAAADGEPKARCTTCTPRLRTLQGVC